MLSTIHVITNGNKKRLYTTKKSLSNYGLTSKIFNFPKHPTNGKLGCFLSHIELYKYARDINLEYIIICEDSINHTMDHIPKKIERELSILLNKPNWNIIFLGAWFIPFTRFTKTSYSSIYKTSSIHGTSCYIIHKRLYMSILNDFQNHQDKHIDRHLVNRGGDEIYIVYPVIFTRSNIIPTTNNYFSNSIVNIYYYINCSKTLCNFWQYYAVHYYTIWIELLFIIIVILIILLYMKKK